MCERLLCSSQHQRSVQHVAAPQDALVNLIRRARPVFLQCVSAKSDGGGGGFDVPALRVQLHCTQILSALQLYRTGLHLCMMNAQFTHLLTLWMLVSILTLKSSYFPIWIQSKAAEEEAAAAHAHLWHSFFIYGSTFMNSRSSGV